MSSVKKVGITLNIGAIVTILGILATMFWRQETAASADKATATTQENRDTKQDSSIQQNTRELTNQDQIHREDFKELRGEVKELRGEVRSESTQAAQRHVELIEMISKARGQ